MQQTQTIFELAINGLYESGLTVFKSTDQPTPAEQRWAAVCYYNLKQYLEAKDLLELAQDRGCQGATIELATVLRLLGQPLEALAQLDRLKCAELSDHDYALERRERGLLEYVRGDYKNALRLLEEAWSIIRRTDLRGPQSAIGQTLGFLFYAMGQNRQALHYLNQALECAGSARAARIRVTRAGCLVGLGLLGEADRDLQMASGALELVPALFGSLAYTSGLLARAQNRLVEALAQFDATIEFAVQQPELETECYAQLQAAGVLMTLGRLDEAHARLTRAQALVQSCGLKGRALLELRQGSLMCLSGDPVQVNAGIDLLARARQDFVAMLFERGVISSDLQLAEAHLLQGSIAAARAELESVNEARLAMACTSALGEVIHLPNTLTYLQALPVGDVLHSMLEEWSNGPEVPAYCVELITFGKPELRVNGKRVGLEITGTVELIAFLLLNPDRTREEVLTALFAKKVEQQAANYFHQAKLTLQRATGVIQVLYDRVKKTYRVNCDIPMFLWDAVELQKILGSSDEDRILKALKCVHGMFLANSDSDWAVTEREKLSWSVVKVGLETLDLWSKRGEYQKCLDLAGRLREIEPLNPALAEYLVIATHSLEGEISARHKLRALEREFEREVGDVPDELLALHSRIGLVN